MNDILPQHTPIWRWLERELTELLRIYGYREIRLPLVENTAVFERSIGDLTDIVQKEMYSFTDRNGDSLTLRPEGTAGCVRAALQNGLVHNQIQRLWYAGPMFRHERPQKGRYRQFYQIGVEAFGMPGPEIDAELILMTARMWRTLGIADLRLEINTLGTEADRAAYRDVLRQYFIAHRSKLDTDSQSRVERNPLRILDSKAAGMQAIIEAAPKLQEFLSPQSVSHFDALRSILDAEDIAYRVNPHLVRGLDYYSNTVFEWITDELGAQGTLCAGGRYDGLVELMGGRPTSAIGFALGLERLVEMVSLSAARVQDTEVDIYIVTAAPKYAGEALGLAEQIRDKYSTIATVCDCTGASLKSQMKKADRSGAVVALIIGDDEHASNAVTVRALRTESEQTLVPRAGLDTFLASFFSI